MMRPMHGMRTVRVRAAALGGALMFAGLLVVSIAGGANRETTLTRSRANAVAMRVLRPQADRGNVILFGLPQALPK